jgi:hypothetical protein
LLGRDVFLHGQMLFTGLQIFRWSRYLHWHCASRIVWITSSSVSR